MHTYIALVGCEKCKLLFGSVGIHVETGDKAVPILECNPKGLSMLQTNWVVGCVVVCVSEVY